LVIPSPEQRRAEDLHEFADSSLLQTIGQPLSVRLQQRLNYMPPPSTLAELPVGSTALIQSLATGSVGLTRLRELGLTPGAKVAVVRRAPLGEPLEVRVRGSHIAMRHHEAAHIFLSPAEA
jgi:ferrous iron transport protein A